MRSERFTGQLPWPGFVLLALLVLAVGGFSLFVGYHKAFSPIEILAQNSAWTVHLPVWLGRMVGVLEVLAASVMLLGLALRPLARIGYFAAIWITLNHVAAALIHATHDEAHALPANAVYLALCGLIVWLYRRRAT
ncbi:MAG: DoxX family protein [Erythrobacter sp.]|nr:MAG: DoxX family protein [Erythrobacter sp.]